MPNHPTPTPNPRGRGARPVSFTYEDLPGIIDSFGLVRWGGAGFHVDSAPVTMLPAIERALRARIVELEGQP